MEQHLRDSAAVAGWLWDNWLSDGTKNFLADAQETTHGGVRAFLVFLAGVHDVGKASPVFVDMVPGFLSTCAQEYGAETIYERVRGRSSHHSRIGHKAVQDELKVMGASRRAAATWAVVVGSHHGDPPANRDEFKALSPGEDSVMGGDFWHQVRSELIAEHVGSSGMADYGWPVLTQPVQVVLTGLVIMADWIASNERLFGYTDLDDPRRLDAAMARLALPAPWRPVEIEDVDELYVERFGSSDEGFEPRPVQSLAASMAAQIPEPGLLVIEAPMGEGKTEAALVAAEIMAARFGAGGLHLCLPTQASADGMFSRVLEWANRLPGDQLSMDSAIWLGHGKAAFNDQWAELLSGSRHIHADDERPRLGPHGWVRGRKRAFLSTVCVSTVDHLLLAGLRAKHLMLRHLGLANKVVVVDEVHAYDAWMSGYLDKVLGWLGTYRVPVVLLSATLPPSRRASLVEAYTGSKPDVSVSGNDGYPLVTTASARGVEQAVPERSSRSVAVKIEFGGTEVDQVLDEVAEAVQAGACVLLVHNTVSRAQRSHRLLSELLGGDRVTLTHSRFLAGDRSRNDVDLLDRFGSPNRLERRGSTRPEGHVVVSTQVAEQSLDVDFDLLVTDLAPVDLVLQRMGRLHRHQRRRPVGFETARTLVIGADGTGEAPVVVRGSRSVYGDWALLRSLDVLLDRSQVNLPDDIADLVRQAYESSTSRQDWVAVEAEALAEHGRKMTKQQGKSEVFQISPVRSGPILGWINGSETDDDVSAARQVRDGADSLEVLVLVRDVAGHLRVPAWLDHPQAGAVVSGDHFVDRSLEHVLGACRLRLPQHLSTAKVETELWNATPPAWKEGEREGPGPLLVLDENLEAVVGSRVLHYDPAFGLDEIKEKK